MINAYLLGGPYDGEIKTVEDGTVRIPLAELSRGAYNPPQEVPAVVHTYYERVGQRTFVYMGEQ